MEKAPKIVTERLQAASLTAGHPDADMLTAFSERALMDRERSLVLEHLARCSECRDVVALALPAEETATTLEVRPARTPWFTWPRMRWAVVAAGVAAVGSVTLLQYQKHQGLSQPKSMALYDASPAAKQEMEARNRAVPAPVAEEVAKDAKLANSVAPAAPSVPARALNERKEFDRLDQFSKLEASKDKNVLGGSVGGPIHGYGYSAQQLAHGPKMPNQFQQNIGGNANVSNSFAFQTQPQTNPVAPPPAFGNPQASGGLVALQQPATSPAATPAQVVPEKQDADALTIAGRSMAPLQKTGSNAGAEIARAKPATTANAPQAGDAEGYVLNGQVSNFSASGSLAPESAQWSINSDGGLQRSMDQGATWQDIDVNAGYGSGAALGLQKAMKSRDKALARKADSKQKPIVFRAVSANGPDVWAGGSEGNLFHSTDSGAHWIRVVASWRGIDLTGDIINLQFSDPQHGRIVTSSAEIWLTADAGQSWEKR